MARLPWLLLLGLAGGAAPADGDTAAGEPYRLVVFKEARTRVHRLHRFERLKRV